MSDDPDSDDTEDVDRLQNRLTRVREEVGKRIVGQTDVVEQLLVCLLCDGNALLESNPGLGKTSMIRTLSEVVDLDFSRIQNTPGLMPSDITGTEIIREAGGSREFVFAGDRSSRTSSSPTRSTARRRRRRPPSSRRCRRNR